MSTVRFSKWPHDDSRIIVRKRGAYVGCIQKQKNGWVPSLDLSTALNGAGGGRPWSRKNWQCELEGVREIREILSPEPEPRSQRVKERDRTMKRIVQQDPHGSGIACVAMLSGRELQNCTQGDVPERRGPGCGYGRPEKGADGLRP